ncbi:MAG: H-type small acid-soluble spore protein [Syntrophomonadaceae bacterium]|jgi:small acid-soluble spore protein H (minor)
MDSKRARDIVNSLGVIEVLHQGRPVWIEALQGEMAQVKYLDTKERFEVRLDQLNES